MVYICKWLMIIGQFNECKKTKTGSVCWAFVVLLEALETSVFNMRSFRNLLSVSPKASCPLYPSKNSWVKITEKYE